MPDSQFHSICQLWETPKTHKMSSVARAAAKLRKAYPWTATPSIVGAPMRVLSGPALAVEISKAGGIGFIGPGAKPQDLEGHLSEASSLISKNSHLSKHHADHIPIGVGVQTWAGDLKVATQILQNQRPAAVWLFAPRHGQPELDDWTQGVRSASPGTQVWIQVASVADARAAASSAHAPDVLVIQGTDAGGHSLTQGAGIIALLPEVVDALQQLSDAAASIPLIAAGGIADGRGAAAALTLGAAGVAMGTRFLAAQEAVINPGYQRHVVEAQDGGQTTVRTQLYNHLRGTTDWPTAFDARGLRNQSWDDHQAGLPFAENKQRHDEAMKLGERGWGADGRIATYAGTNVGLIREVKPAGIIVDEVRAGVGNALEAAVRHSRL